MLILLKENKDNRFFRSMAYDDQFEERLVNDRTNPTCSDLRELVKTTSSLVQAYTIAADGSLNLTHLEEFGKLGCPISVVHKDAMVLCESWCKLVWEWTLSSTLSLRYSVRRPTDTNDHPSTRRRTCMVIFHSGSS